ncbi:MAG: M23 family metallopeptidase [Bacilli bacterium]|nr:M23 family metallopeptidase [Bacilli bacterium]
MKKKLRLRGYVIPSICILLLGIILYSGYKIWELVDVSDQEVVPTNYVNKSTNERITPTISVVDAIIKPYDNENVKVSIPFYNINDSDSNQQSALIYYENIYMQNTGIMYTCENEFNVIAVLDGTIKDIKDDPIMGKIVEIDHNNNNITIYQSLANVNVSVGQKVIQGEIIGVSGQNKIVNNDLYALHFEVYKDGELINPESFYKLSIEELNEQN